MTDFLDLAPAQRGPVERITSTRARFGGGAGQSWAGPGTDWFPFEGGAGQSWAGFNLVHPFEGGAGQSWAGPGTDWFPFEGGAEQSWAGPGTDWFPFEGGAEQSLDPRPGGSPFEG